MRVAVSGSRHATDDHWPTILEALEYVNIHYGITYLIIGDADGVDDLVKHWASIHSIPTEVHQADWNKYGRGAGPVRNQHMIDQVPDYWVAFPLKTSVGTWDFVKKAVRAQIPGQIVAL